jgi:hypothetical protein
VRSGQGQKAAGVSRVLGCARHDGFPGDPGPAATNVGLEDGVDRIDHVS